MSSEKTAGELIVHLVELIGCHSRNGQIEKFIPLTESDFAELVACKERYLKQQKEMAELVARENSRWALIDKGRQS